MAQASAKNLEHTGPAEKKRLASVPQSEQLASTPGQALPKQKRTEPSVQIARGKRVKVSESRIEAGGSEREHGEKRVDSTVKDSKFQEGEVGQARRASVGEGMSG